MFITFLTKIPVAIPHKLCILASGNVDLYYVESPVTTQIGNRKLVVKKQNMMFKYT